MKKDMQQLVNDYAQKYLPNKDRFKCLDVIELFNMAEAQADADKCPDNYKYHLLTFALQAGYMKGYNTAKYEARKKAQKGKK